MVVKRFTRACSKNCVWRSCRTGTHLVLMLHKCNGVLMHVLRPTKVDKKNSSKLTEFALCALISFDSHGKAAGKKKDTYDSASPFFFFLVYSSTEIKRRRQSRELCVDKHNTFYLLAFSVNEKKKKGSFFPSRFFYHQVIRVYVFSLAAM